MSNKQYYTLISFVCKNNVTELSKIWDEFPKDKLMEANFSLNEKSKPLPNSSLTLMHIAAFYNSLETFIFLQEKGLSINAQSLDSYEDIKYYPIHYACYKGSYEVAEYILSADPSQFTYTWQVDLWLINLVIISDKADMLRLLLKNGFDLNDPEIRKFKPLLRSIVFHSKECMKILLENGIKYESDQNGYSPIMTAIARSFFEAVPILYEAGQFLDCVSKKNETALSLACFHSSQSTVQFICDHMDNVDIDPSIQCKSAVHWICKSESLEIAKIVLSKGIDVNRLDEDGHPGPYYLLSISDENITIEMLDLLYKHGLDLNVHGVSENGKKAPSILELFLCSVYRPPRVLEWLLKHDAMPDVITIINPNLRIIDFVMRSRFKNLRKVFEENVPAELVESAIAKIK